MRIRPDGWRAGARVRPIAGALTAWLLLAVLGAGVLTGYRPQLRLDGAVAAALYVGDHPPPWLELLLQALTAPGLTAVRLAVLLPVGAWLATRRAWRTVAWVATAGALVGPVTSVLKEAFGRLRPGFSGGGARYGTLSYPSGHSSGIATLVVVALVLAWPLLRPRARPVVAAVGVAAVVVVGLSRMWLGVHYLTDVVGGWALGTAWTLSVALAYGALPGGPAALAEGRGDGVAAGAAR